MIAGVVLVEPALPASWGAPSSGRRIVWPPGPAPRRPRRAPGVPVAVGLAFGSEESQLSR